MVISRILQFVHSWKPRTSMEPKEIHVRVRDLAGLTLFQGHISSLKDLQDKIENDFGIAIYMQKLMREGCPKIVTTEKDLENGNALIDLTLIFNNPGHAFLPSWQYVPAQNKMDGYWYTPMSVIYIGPDVWTGQLAYNEILYADASSRLHGWLRPKEFSAGTLVWRVDATKIIFDTTVWYGPSFGEMPLTECVIDIIFYIPQDPDDDMIRLQKSTEDDQQFATRFYPECESNNL